jgi:hypothetical protein
MYIVYQWGRGKHLIINLDVFQPKYNALLELHNMKLGLDPKICSNFSKRANKEKI